MVECEAAAANGYVSWQPEWLPHAIPQENNRIDKCRRYIGNETSIALDHERRDKECPAELFNTNQKVGCDEFVFKTEEVGVSNEVSMDVIDIQSYVL